MTTSVGVMVLVAPMLLFFRGIRVLEMEPMRKAGVWSVLIFGVFASGTLSGLPFYLSKDMRGKSKKKKKKKFFFFFFFFSLYLTIILNVDSLLSTFSFSFFFHFFQEHVPFINDQNLLLLQMAVIVHVNQKYVHWQKQVISQRSVV